MDDLNDGDEYHRQVRYTIHLNSVKKFLTNIDTNERFKRLSSVFETDASLSYWEDDHFFIQWRSLKFGEMTIHLYSIDSDGQMMIELYKKRLNLSHRKKVAVHDLIHVFDYWIYPFFTPISMY